MNTIPLRTLIIGTPLWDKTACIDGSVLINIDLPKGGRRGAVDIHELQILWNRVKNQHDKIKGNCGGSGTNVMMPLALLGNTSCSILGCIGRDRKAEKIETHLSKLGVHSLLKKSDAASTGRVICFITDDGDRSMLTYQGAASEFSTDDVIEKHREGALEDFKHWHVEGYAVFTEDLVPTCIEIAKDKGASISINLPTKDVILAKLDVFRKNIDKFDYIVGNVEEICALTGIDDVQLAIAAFSKNQVVAITDGPKDCWIKPQNECNAVAYAVPSVDIVRNMTGAGDIWAGAFLALALQGKPTEACVSMANLVAGEWIKQPPGTHLADDVWHQFKNSL